MFVSDSASGDPLIGKAVGKGCTPPRSPNQWRSTVLNYSPQSLSASPARSITVNGQQKRALRKLLRDLVAFTGTAINDLAATPRKAPQPKRQRLLYRHADSLTDADLDRLVAELGVERVMRALDRLTQPSLPFAVVSEAVG